MALADASAGDTPTKVFRGYDSVKRGMLAATAVKGKYEKSGGRSVVNIRVCESVSELAQALEIDGSLSVSYLKAANVTAKMDFARSLNVTANSVTIVVYASHETGNWSVTHAELEDGVKPPENPARSAKQFAHVYGDSFVSGATQGGEYFAVYTFQTETRSQKTSLTGELKVKGIYSGITAKVDVQAKLSDFLKTTKVSWTFKQRVTGLSKPTLPDQDKLIEYALSFPSRDIDAPVTTGFTVTGYEEVPGFGDNFEQVQHSRRAFLRSNGILNSLNRLQVIERQTRLLRDIYDHYRFEGDPALAAFHTKVKADLAKLDDLVDDWEDDPTQTFTKPDLPALAQGEPVLNYAAGQPASFGKEGGGSFDFRPVGDALRNLVKISSIRLSDGGGIIKRIEIGYSSATENWTESHGNGGSQREIFYLEDGQFLNRMSINCGEYVDRLVLYSTDGRHTEAGGSGGSLHEWKVPDGSFVLGFAGREGLALDQIKILHVALKPATYAPLA